MLLFYFINSLFKRKSVLNLTQVSIKISKISCFILNEKKKVSLKMWFGEGGYEKTIAGGG